MITLLIIAIAIIIKCYTVHYITPKNLLEVWLVKPSCHPDIQHNSIIPEWANRAIGDILDSIFTDDRCGYESHLHAIDAYCNSHSFMWGSPDRVTHVSSMHSIILHCNSSWIATFWNAMRDFEREVQSAMRMRSYRGARYC